MLVYLEPWVVQDGQVPELRPGDVLRGVGVAAACWSCGPSEGHDTCVARSGKDPDGFSTAQAVLDGVVVWRDETRAGVLSVEGTLFLIRGTVKLVAPPDYYEREPVSLPPIGGRARLGGYLYVMPAHENDLYSGAVSQPPDVCRDWVVTQVLRERRAVDGRECGDVIGVDTLEVMDCWADEVAGGTYLLDLSPQAPPPQ
jgi:hypothetical protein